MFRNNNSPPSYGHLAKWLSESNYTRLEDLPEYYEYLNSADGRTAPARGPGPAPLTIDGYALQTREAVHATAGLNPADAPWPAFSAVDGYDVHLPPMADECKVVLVKSDTGQVVARGWIDAGEQFGDDGGRLVARTVESILNTDEGPVDEETGTTIVTETARAAAGRFADPFDSEIRRKLERPQARWVKARTATVEVTEDPHGRTLWTPTITAGRAVDDDREWSPSYPTSELAAQYENGFRRDFRRQFDDKITFHSHSAWPIWFRITYEYLSDAAIVREYSEDDLVDASIEEYQFRRSSTGTWHLQHRDGGTHGCQHAGGADGPVRDATLDEPPVPTVLCPACSSRLKELQADHTLRGSTV